MKRIRVGIILMVILLLLSMIIIPYNQANAEANTIKLCVSLYRENGKGYIAGSSSSLDSEYSRIIWKLGSKNDDGSMDYSKNIYCLYAERGFATDDQSYENDISEEAEYDYHADMNKENQDNILEKWKLNGLQDSNGDSKSDEYKKTYNKILWILDHMYIPEANIDNTNNKIEFLKRIPLKDSNSNVNIYEHITTEIDEEIDLTNDLTDDLIEVAQQLAIWHFTNSNDNNYNNENGITVYECEKQDDVNSKEIDGIEINGELDTCINSIYKYLIENADENYTGEENSLGYATKATFWTNNNSTNQPVVIVEKAPKVFDLSLRKRITKIEKANETVQNLAIDRVMADNSITFYAEDGDAASQIRNLTINTEKLDDSSDDNGDYKTTTAEYKHQKDPVTVETGDKVTYTITIFNEGEIDGRATEITDQLPSGLKFLKEETQQTYASENYEYDYDDNENRIVIKEKQGSTHSNLTAYKKDHNLSKTEIHVICQLVEERGDKEKVLTNVAWISDDYNASNVEDRDSDPKKLPTANDESAVTKDNIENYRGTTDEEKELSDSNYYYPGYEDDDDFDKLVLPSRDKVFDLALRKYITKVETENEDETRTTTDIENTETQRRNPEIDKSTLQTGTTATYKHRKDPVLVKTGDLVTYNITVYNEGEVAGRAKEIIDQLPKGLKFNSEETLKLDENANYNFAYDESANKVTITEKETQTNNDLNPYNPEGNEDLDSTTIKVVCTVEEKASDKEIILTNIAWISKAYNKDANKDIVSDRYSVDKKADRDSVPNDHPTKMADELNTENVGYTGKNNYNKNELNNSNNYYKGIEDDDDFEKVKLLPDQIDLSLRKFITEINSKGNVRTITDREPKVDTSTIATDGTATYNHPKTPISVKVGDIITYTIRVYNEGGLDGYASEITDHLPEWLEFMTNTNATTDEEKEAADFNTEYLWVLGDDGRTVKTDILSQDKSNIYKTLTNINRESTLLTAYDGGDTLDYLDVKIKCKVRNVESGTKITNIADITEMENKNGDIIDEDRDSHTNPGVDVPNDNDLPNYKDDKIERGDEYIPGQEDDDDFEKVVVEIFDLALRKFITAVDDEAITSRYPQVNYDEETEKMTFTHPKDPVGVSNGKLVTYTIRVYNQGDIAGYATEVTDNLPEGLLYVPENTINQKYRWKMIDANGNETQNVEEAVYITTDYLSKAEEDATGRNNLLNAFDKNAEISNTNPDYRDIEVVFKVIEPDTSDRILTNTAQISEDEDENGNPIDDIDSIPNNDEEYDFDNEQNNEDDIDFDRVELQCFDLALRKFITAVNDDNVTTRYPNVSYDEAQGKITYTHPKDPVDVANGDIVTYTIRIYNEGERAGYADEVTDDMPEGLEFVPENSTNKEYRWKMIDAEGKETTDVTKAVKITTDYLSKAEADETGRDNLLKAFNKELGITDENPDYRDLKVAFRVTEPNNSDRILVNTAEISEDKDEHGKPVEDIDSTPDNNKDGEDDIDKEYVKLKCFDLALRKFITAVNDTPVNNRYPSLSQDENGKIVYTHTKDPVQVENGNIVTYTIRVYNEGEMAGYADEITDDMPEGLEFVPDNSINKEYRWKMLDESGKETIDVSKGVKITTDYLSKAQADETQRDNLLKAFDKELGITETNPDYRDVKIAFKVTEPNTSDRVLVNTAEITEDKDEHGKPVEDIDSTPDNNKDGEDDIDKEYVEVKYFDLALKKWVSQAIVIDGKNQTVIDSGHTGDENPEPPVKVDIKENKLNSIIVKFVYQIKVTNEGQIAGYAKEVKDHIPEGLEFVQEDNPDWYRCEDGTVATAKLENTLLQPGESATVTIVLRWINNNENLGQKVNFAEISKDYNESHTPDIDSKPDNFKDKPIEDDEDEAPVLLGIQTGAAVMYIGLTTIILVTLAGGIILIKKYVL